MLQPRDIFLVGYLPAMALLAWCLPQASWRRLCAASVPLSGGVHRRRRAEQRQHITDLLAGRPLARDADRITAGLVANHHHARLQILRSHRPGSWQPCIILSGREHVEQALRAGRGGILWVAPFVFSDLVTKMAFYQAGFSVSHLSRTEHGFSPSRFGTRVLNPIWTSIERRYVVERFVISGEESVGALRRVIRRVRENQLVSITISSQGQRTHTAPFLNGRLQVAEGAPALACRTGAALLPVFTVHTAEGAFVTTVEAPLQVAPDLEREAVVQSLVAQCAMLLESYTLRWPDQYGGWELVKSR